MGWGISSRWMGFIAIVAVVGVAAAWLRGSRTQIYRVKFQANGGYLLVEVLDDDLFHFELSAGTGPNPDQPLYTTPMVYKTDYPGATRFTRSGPEGNTLETADVKVVVDTRRLCVTITDKTKDVELTTICPKNLTQTWKGLTLRSHRMQHVYGLGEQFLTPGSPDGDWVGRVRSPGNSEGNALVSFDGGAVGNAQFPILYAVGGREENYALFLDQIPKQRWDFTRQPWQVDLWGDQIRWYVMTGPDLPDLRMDYMELVGRPPVLPKKMFGLWISEYGYDNWAELEQKLSRLRANHFPVDGFVLDLQWFGGITSNSDHTRMGTLTWDTKNFPDPVGKIAWLRQAQGIGLMLIEESYIGRALAEHEVMERRGYLVRECESCSATYLTHNPWWGRGGMIDWTNDQGADYWHDWKRQPLVDMGILGHWTDLGEPELYNVGAWYYGFPEQGKHAHIDVHNLYNFKWSESIFRGYQRHRVARRPFILSRSGAPGSQRFGVALWSGDIGSNLSSLAAHLNVQMHMSLSGIDYFGADIGGFHRGAAQGDINEMYTQWLANGLMFDVPARPHVSNVCNCHESAPDRIGDVASNRENVRLRYELSPYLYSLAHRAYLYGEPVIPPLVYYYQNDRNVRTWGHEKLLGRDLLVAAVARHGETKRDVYLPAGTWINYHTNEWFRSSGQWLRDVPVYLQGRFKLPLFARAGAIIPQMYVDEKTMNILGQRSDGSRRDELIVRVYADQTPTSFTLYEDDGETIAYQQGEIRTTVISQQKSGERVIVTIHGSSGSYAGAPSQRDNVIKLIVNNTQATRVSLNGQRLPQYTTPAALDAASNGWCQADRHLILAKSGPLAVTQAKTFEVWLRP